MNSIRRAFTSAVLLTLASACQRQTYTHDLFMRDNAGQVIAIASINLPPVPLPTDTKIKGKWVLQSWEDEFPLEATSVDQYQAKIEGTSVFVDLNPGWGDNNVVLNGELVGSLILGTWCQATLGGCIEKGKFEVVPIPKPLSHKSLASYRLTSGV